VYTLNKLQVFRLNNTINFNDQIAMKKVIKNAVSWIQTNATLVFIVMYFLVLRQLLPQREGRGEYMFQNSELCVEDAFCFVVDCKWRHELHHSCRIFEHKPASRWLLEGHGAQSCCNMLGHRQE
jgi:hypothetical protein